MSGTEQTSRILATVRTVVDLLARRDYIAVERLTDGVRLAAEDMRVALLRLLPDARCTVSFSCGDVDIVEIRDSQPRRWSVNVPLYDGSGSKSDLTMALTLIEDGGPSESMSVELDDIHVL